LLFFHTPDGFFITLLDLLGNEKNCGITLDFTGKAM